MHLALAPPVLLYDPERAADYETPLERCTAHHRSSDKRYYLDPFCNHGAGCDSTNHTQITLHNALRSVILKQARIAGQLADAEPSTRGLLNFQHAAPVVRALFPKQLTKAARAKSNELTRCLQKTSSTEDPEVRKAWVLKCDNLCAEIAALNVNDKTGLRLDVATEGDRNERGLWIDVKSMHTSADSYAGSTRKFLLIVYTHRHSRKHKRSSTRNTYRWSTPDALSSCELAAEPNCHLCSLPPSSATTANSPATPSNSSTS